MTDGRADYNRLGRAAGRARAGRAHATDSKGFALADRRPYLRRMKIRPALIALLSTFTLVAACSSSSADPADVGADSASLPDGGGADDDAEAPDAEAPDAEPPDADPIDAPSVGDGVHLRQPPVLTGARLFAPGDGVGTVRVQPAYGWLEAFRVIAVWTGDDGDGGLGIWVSTLDASGAEVTTLRAPERLNTDTRGIQNEPAVCLDNNRPVVVWSVDTQETGPDGENLEIRFRRLDGNGAPVDATDRRVLTERAGNHWLGHIACPSNGFAVAGVRPADPGAGFEVFVQRFTRDGEPAGTVIVPKVTTFGQGFPRLATSGLGDLYVAFEDAASSEADGVILAGRVYPTAGPLRTVASAAGQDPVRAVIAVDPRDEGFMAGGTVGVAVQLARFADADDLTGAAVTLPEAVGATVTNATVAPLGEGRYAVVYTRGTGSAVDLRLAYVEADGMISEDATVASGSFPLAYRPTIAYRFGYLAVGWTESLGDGDYAVRGAVYRDQP